MYFYNMFLSPMFSLFQDMFAGLIIFIRLDRIINLLVEIQQ